MTNIKDIVSGVQTSKIQTKTGKILLTLIRSSDKDGWVSGGALRKFSNDLSSLRDLRRATRGGFTIETAHASDLGKKTDNYYYRVVLSKSDIAKVKSIFQ